MAFVVQRCGQEVNGGAESLCLQVAGRMSRFWQTEILTTCALDYMTWSNHYPSGVEEVAGTSIRRFRVDTERNVSAFDRLSADLVRHGSNASLEEQEHWMRAQGPFSSSLFEYLEKQREQYDAFIFFGYLYATTYFGLPLVEKKSILAPLGHDEWTIAFSMWTRFFQRPKGFVFQTQEEKDFLARRFPLVQLRGPIAGVGIDPPQTINCAAFRKKYRVEEPFLLYVGRIDVSKGCGPMFEYFLRWKKEFGAPHKLMLAGREVMPVPFHDDIIHLGFISDEEKWAAMKACDWLIMPSLHESLSMALLEAWSTARPALVNAKCAVLTRHCQESHGGLWYSTFEEWSAALSMVDEETKRILGCQGRAYVQERYSWDRVESSYLKTVESIG